MKLYQATGITMATEYDGRLLLQADAHLDDEEALALAVALIQATPGDDDLRRETVTVHAGDGTTREEPCIYLPDDVSGTYGITLTMPEAMELGLALIRAASKESAK